MIASAPCAAGILMLGLASNEGLGVISDDNARETEFHAKRGE
jgi:hypothetical protein